MVSSVVEIPGDACAVDPHPSREVRVTLLCLVIAVSFGYAGCCVLFPRIREEEPVLIWRNHYRIRLYLDVAPTPETTSTHPQILARSPTTDVAAGHVASIAHDGPGATLAGRRPLESYDRT